MAVIVHKRLLDAKEAAEYLSISRVKLYEWLAKGKVPSVTIDSCRLFDVLKLDQFVDSLNGNERLHA